MNTEQLTKRWGSCIWISEIYAEYHWELKSPEIFLKNYVKEVFLLSMWNAIIIFFIYSFG